VSADSDAVDTPETHGADLPDARPRRGVWHLIRVGITAGVLSLVAGVVILAIILPAVSGAQTYTILTRSMEPSYPPGTLIVVRPVDAADLRVGSVITFQVSPGKEDVITHRIIAITLGSDESRSFTTMGDNNAVADDVAVLPEQIRGEVWYALPWIGSLSTLRSQGGLGVLVPVGGGVLLLVAAYYLIAWGKERRQRS
jgi:signal peptidase